MAKSTKKFFITRTSRKYDGTAYYRPTCWARYSTREEAEAEADSLNRECSKESREAIYRSWVADPSEPQFDEAWFERKKNELFYSTFEVKESK